MGEDHPTKTFSIKYTAAHNTKKLHIGSSIQCSLQLKQYCKLVDCVQSEAKTGAAYHLQAKTVILKIYAT